MGFENQESNELKAALKRVGEAAKASGKGYASFVGDASQAGSGQKTIMLICFLLAQSIVLYATKQMKLQHKLSNPRNIKRCLCIMTQVKDMGCPTIHSMQSYRPTDRLGINAE